MTHTNSKSLPALMAFLAATLKSFTIWGISSVFNLGGTPNSATLFLCENGMNGFIYTIEKKKHKVCRRVRVIKE
jgi:hypothetical protein